MVRTMKQKTRPFILYPKKHIEDVRDCVLENYGYIKYELPFLNALCVEIPEQRISTIRANRRIAMMSEDALVSKLSEDQETDFSQQKTRKPLRSSKGEGVGIAVIDTGVAPHYDLIKPFNRILCFKDFVNKRETPYDDDGHGTHVAGIALGSGFVSNECTGSAPMAGLVALKALDSEGNGNASDILAAMQWIYEHHKDYNIRVVNLSLGVTPSKDLLVDPLVLGANALVCAGICVVTAAGNSGPGRGTITSPGTSPLVITVGSCDDQGAIASFSSRGPTASGKIKPDFLAPGVEISSLSAENPKTYISQTGTSMSAPFVSGIIANYCCLHPKTQPSAMKKILINYANPIKKTDRNTQGYGLLFKDAFI